METIKKYLAEIASDENQVKDFLEKNETEIRSFFAELWRKHSPTAVVQPGAETAVDNQQAQTGMQRFNSGVQPDGVQPDNEKAKNDALAFQIKNKQITFQNGKVSQEYCVDFDIETLGIPDIAEVTFEGLEAIGLQYLPEKKCIKGNPTQAGDHKIEMKFKRKDWEEGKPLLMREVVFIINPDPRVLWSKNIPTPEDIEYYKPDSGKLFVKVESKKTKGVFGLGKKELARKDMVAASQRGRSHAIEGKPRDDDFLLYFDEETEWYVMVVADGAGSAQFSRKGSQIACRAVIEVCQEKIAAKKEDFSKRKATEQKNEIGEILQEIISNAVFSAHKTIETEAKEKGRPIKDYSTTLLVSLCKKFDYGWFVGAWWVGDGGIGIYRKEPEYLKVLGEPDGGEFAGQTRFLTMPDIIQKELYTRIRFDVVEDFTALILMTDGVTDPKFETDANLNRIEKWRALWDDLNGSNDDGVKVAFSDDNEQVAEQLLKWLDFWSKGNHDDRTIAILF
jgi:serine/threonine protein phosphatase PrpC